MIAAAMVASATPALALPATPPGAPGIGTATAGNGQETITFTAPSSNGGATIDDYFVVVRDTADHAPFDCGAPSVTSLSCDVTGLTNGTPYSFKVAAHNSVGTGNYSTTINGTPTSTTPTITFAQPTDITFGTARTFSATSSSGIAVAFTSETTGVCTVTSAGVLTSVTAGTCKIDANDPGDSTHAPGTLPRTFTITATAPGAPTNLQASPASLTSASIAFTAPTSNGGSAITQYTATSSPDSHTGTCSASPCTVSGLTTGTAYTFTITAKNGAVASSGPASAPSNTVRTNAIAQTITFAQPTTPQNFGATPTLTASTNATGLTVTFASVTTDVCTITSGGALTTVSVGSCIIRADQAGDSTRASAAPVERTIAITKATPTVAVTSTANPAVYGQPLTFTATLTNPLTSTGNVQFNIDNVDVGSPVALNASGTASYSPSTPLSVGTHTVKATYAGDANHNTANASLSPVQTINKADSVTTVQVSGDTITATVSAASPATGTPTGGVAFTVGGVSAGSASLTNGVATITGSNVGNQGVGASYTGDTNYNSSVGHRAPIGPTVRTRLSSAHAKHNGWYRSPVTVSFTCTPNTAPLSNGCPAAVTKTHNGAGQTVTRTVRATDGGKTTVTRTMSIDQVKPTLTVKRKASGRLVCHAHDTLSHGATCSVHHTTSVVNGVRVVKWNAVAHDRAGNTRHKHGKFTG